jgi:alginate O-acetyltransferase complex protein AlgI
MLVIVSVVFYAALDLRFLWFPLALTTFSFCCGLAIERQRTQAWPGRVLVVGVVGLVVCLLLFKYGGAAVDWSLRLTGQVPAVQVTHHWLMPVACSFMIFRCISYLVEVYRGQVAAERSALDFSLFSLFFPSLLAGPITRASDTLPQLKGGRRPDLAGLKVGASVFLWGFTKKVLVADRLAPIADQVFASPQVFSPATIWCGVLAYSLQIYTDFSGYSDMAIGAARVLGYELPLNFNMPYLSRSIGEFWRRWHVSLSTWLRDYLFLPLAYPLGRGLAGLGWPRKWEEQATFSGAALATMAVAGVWHGTGWGFLVWGLAHGLAMAVQRLWWAVWGRRHPMPTILATSLTFLFVTLAWLPFRAGSLATVLVMLQKCLFLDRVGFVWYPEWLLWCGALVVGGHVANCCLLLDRVGKRARAFLGALGCRVESGPISGRNVVFERVTVGGVYAIGLLLAAVFVFGAVDFNPFVYAQY